jgi:hypothetical protein
MLAVGLIIGGLAYASHFREMNASPSNKISDGANILQQKQNYTDPYNPLGSNPDYIGSFSGKTSAGNPMYYGKKVPDNSYFKPANTYAANWYSKDNAPIHPYFSKQRQQERIDYALNEDDFFLRPESKLGFRPPQIREWRSR